MPILILLLALLGALDASWLVHASLFGAASCGSGSGCGSVLASPHARVFGVPLSAFGLGYYLAVVAAAWRALRPTERHDALRGAFLLSVLAAAVTLYLLYLQAVVLRAWCPYCLASSAIVLVLLALTASYRTGSGSFRPTRHLLPVAVALVAPPVLTLFLEERIRKTALDATFVPPEVVARIGPREITTDEMDRAIRLRLNGLRNELRSEWLDGEVLAAEAKKRGLTLAELIQKEVLDSIPIGQDEVNWRYEQIRHQVPAGISRDSIDTEIRRELRWYRSKPARDAYVARLRGVYGTALTPPASERLVLDANPRGGPEKGPEDAPVTIVEFSDLECVHCAAAHADVERLIADRPNDIRVVFRHYPLKMHAHARRAAEYAACAHRQGAFWKVAPLLFANQKQLAEEDLRRHAASAGLDLPRLDACLSSGEASAIVDADTAEGKALGVDGTPTFFVNGHYVDAPERLRAVVDRELGRGGR
jgi:protein-disulfide isomerase/uncharacterized membrane protein